MFCHVFTTAVSYMPRSTSTLPKPARFQGFLFDVEEDMIVGFSKALLGFGER